MVDGNTQPGTSCSCSATPRNFRIYDKFNRSMRGVVERGEAEPEYQWFHYHLNNAVEHLPGAKAKQILYRGQGKRYGQEYEPGEIHVWKDYKSTSTNPRAAEQFALVSEERPDPVFFVITGARDNLGAKFSIRPGLSAWPDEDEILLPAGATFVVKKKQMVVVKKQGAAEEEYRGMKVTLKYLGEWWMPEYGRLTKICKGVSHCLLPSQKRGHASGSEIYRPRKEETANADVAFLNSQAMQGWNAATHASQTGLLEHPTDVKDHVARLAMQHVQKHRELQRVHEDDPLCFEYMEHGMSQDNYEMVRAAMQAWRTQVVISKPLTDDDAIAAWLWITSHKVQRVDTPRDEFLQLYYHLSNAVDAVAGLEADTTLFRAKPFLTADEDEAYIKDAMVRWQDFRFSFKHESSLGLDLDVATPGDTACIVFELRNVQANLGAYFGRTDPPLSPVVAHDELLLPAGLTFRVVSRKQEGDKRNRYTRIVLDYAGLDGQAEDDCADDVRVLEKTLGLLGNELDSHIKKVTVAERTTARAMRKLRLVQKMGGVSSLVNARAAAASASADGGGGDSDSDGACTNNVSQASLLPGATDGS